MRTYTPTPNPIQTKLSVESIHDKRIVNGRTDYFVKWKEYHNKASTWESVENLCCYELIEAYEKTLKVHELPDADRIKGFHLGLEPDKIIGATDVYGDLIFLMQWKGANEASLVLAKDANIVCPQIVIKFYEEHVIFDPKPNANDGQCTVAVNDGKEA